MKDLAMLLIALGVLMGGGAIAYYYAYYLPQQNAQQQQDLNAIRKVVAPTQQEQEDALKEANDYLKCVTEGQKRVETWLHQKCDIPNESSPLNAMNCRISALGSSEYQRRLGCEYPY